MNLEGLLGACRLILWGSLLIVALMTVATGWLTSEIEKTKNKKADELIAGNQQLQASNENLLQRIDQYQKHLAEKDQKIQELETGQNALQEQTQATSFILADAQKTALGNGQFKTVFLLVPQGHNVIPIFDVGVKSRDGVKVLSLEIECKTTPPFKSEYPDEPADHRRVVFQNIPAEPIKLIAITERDTVLSVYSPLKIRKA